MNAHQPDTMTPELPGVWLSDHIDDLDRAIISLLQANGRASYKSIGESLKVSEATARKRVTRLLSENLIQVVAIPNPDALGNSMMALARLRANNSLQQLSDELHTWPEITWVAQVAGDAEMLVEILCEDRQSLLVVLQNLSDLPAVREVTTYVYLSVQKRLYLGPLVP